MTDRSFNLLAITAAVAIVSYFSWLDRDLIARDMGEEQVTAEDLADAGAWEAGRQADVKAAQERHLLQVRAAYAQGLQDGTAATLAAIGGKATLQVAQACAALRMPINTQASLAALEPHQ